MSETITRRVSYKTDYGNIFVVWRNYYPAFGGAPISEYRIASAGGPDMSTLKHFSKVMDHYPTKEEIKQFAESYND